MLHIPMPTDGPQLLPDYLRALTTAQWNMQAAGIPLTLSTAEQCYYMCELGLSTLQRQAFLAQLSGRADVSDDYLQSLSPDAVVRRRESLLPAPVPLLFLFSPLKLAPCPVCPAAGPTYRPHGALAPLALPAEQVLFRPTD